jgi:hypothetical protein
VEVRRGRGAYRAVPIPFPRIAFGPTRLSFERMLRSYFCAALSVNVSPLEMDNAMLTSESVMCQHKTV